MRVIAPNSRRTMNIPMKNRDVLLAKIALIGILSLAAGLSAQGQSPEPNLASGESPDRI